MRKQKVYHNQRGVVLIAIIVLLVMCAILFSVAMHSMSTAFDQMRIQETEERLRVVQTAILGHPFITHNDSGNNYGYFSTHTTLPATGTLTTQFSELHNEFSSYPATQDAYGNAFELQNAAGTFTVRSKGKNGTAGDADDITISFPTAAYETNTIQVQILDATNSGVLTGSPSYIVASGKYQGHTILDNQNISVQMSLANVSTITIQHVTASGVFQAVNIPFGYQRMRIRTKYGLTDQDIKPYWGLTGVTNEPVSTQLFVAPVGSGTAQRFNVIYPVSTWYRTKQLSTTDDSANPDKTVDNGGVDYASMTDMGASNTEYQTVGSSSNGYPDGGAARVFRSLIKFDLTSGFTGLRSTSRIIRADLRLYPHRPGSPNLAESRGAGKVCVYRYTGASWTEGTNHTWANMDSYGNVQDTWNVEDFTQIFPATGTGFHDFNVTEAIRNWMTGTWPTNDGFIIRLETSNAGAGGETGNNFFTYKAQETSSGTLRPSLRIAYYR